MSILIRGMEMPKEGTQRVMFITIDSTGLVELLDPDTNTLTEEYHAVPVPPHGDLIDRDALPWENQGLMLTDPDEWGLKASDIENAPIIIPAEEGE